MSYTNKPEIGELEEHQRTHEPRKNNFLQQGHPQLLCTMPQEYQPVLGTFYNTVLTYPKIEITNFFLYIKQHERKKYCLNKRFTALSLGQALY